MSAIRRPKIDRFSYGWRDVVRKGRDGRPCLVQVPLTTRVELAAAGLAAALD
jgi:hypothetical protein